MQTEERRAGVRGALAALAENPVKNKAVLIKPNFNTADPAPGSTHNDTLAALVDQGSQRVPADDASAGLSAALEKILSRG